MNEEQLRAWAIEQSVKHHGGTGVSMDRLIAEAELLIKFVKAQKDAAAQPAGT